MVFHYAYIFCNYPAAFTITCFPYPELSCCKHPSTLKGEKQFRMFLYWYIQRTLRGRMLTAGQLKGREASDGESGWIVTKNECQI